jgi:hypothetical protein
MQYVRDVVTVLLGHLRTGIVVALALALTVFLVWIITLL